MNVFYYASFLGVMALAVERFLAIQLHLRYQKLVTRKRVVTTVISLWVISVFLSLFVFVIQKVRFVIFTTIQVFCLISTAVLFFKIYLAVRRHSRQIQSTQPAAEQCRAKELPSLLKICRCYILCVPFVFGVLPTTKLSTDSRYQPWISR